jgi:hypothetical protein
MIRGVVRSIHGERYRQDPAGRTRSATKNPKERSMENQHRKIEGYRELNANEIELMNEVKKMGDALKVALDGTEQHIRNQRENAGGNMVEHQRISDAEALRWCSIAKTHFQQGLMALTRAVAQPTKF